MKKVNNDFCVYVLATNSKLDDKSYRIIEIKRIYRVYLFVYSFIYLV